MGEGWPLVPLAEVLVQDRSYVDAPEPREYPKLSVKLYGRGVVLDAPANGAELKMQRHQLARAGQVILSEIWGKKGAIGLVPPEGDGALCTSHFFLFDLVLSRIEPGYLRLLFRANYLEAQLGGEARGTTGYAAVRPKHLLTAAIPLPPIEEQRRIVARVEAITAKVEEAQRLRQESEEETDVAHRHAVDTLLKDERWPRRTLRSLLREPSRNGLSARPSAAPPGHPILRISAATSRSDARVEESDVRYLEIDEREAAKYLLSKGDLLACRFNGNLRFVGRFALYCGESGREQVYPDKLIRFRLEESIANPRFVTYAMNSDPGRRLIEALCATTAGNIGISAARLQEVTLPLPPLPDQVRIVSEIGRLEEALKRIRRTQREAGLELDALLPSVLDRAFRGEL